MVNSATVKLWGRNLGALFLDERNNLITFQYYDDFGLTGYDVSPILYPFEKGRIFSKHIPRGETDTFKGLPEFIADILPDKWGTALMDSWLARNGRDIGSCNAIERLLYMGDRGMGALEFVTDMRPELSQSIKITELDGLAKVAAEILQQRKGVVTNMGKEDDALKTIISIGTSAGGSRAKAVVAYNKESGEIRSGQVPAPEGFEHYLLKLDGVTNTILGDPRHFTSIEYSYYKLAKACHIKMMESCLLHDRGRRHFLTKRYDRAGNRKLHKVSLCGLTGMDFNMPGAFSYEQMFSAMRALGLKHSEAEQAFRRMVFNVVGRNQDDHTKNVEFLMDEQGEWSLAPAFDMTYAFNPSREWTAHHQMTINGKNDNFTLVDLLKVADAIKVKNGKEIIDEIQTVFLNFEDYMENDISETMVEEMKRNLVLNILK